MKSEKIPSLQIFNFKGVGLRLSTKLFMHDPDRVAFDLGTDPSSDFSTATKHTTHDTQLYKVVVLDDDFESYAMLERICVLDCFFSSSQR